MHLTVYAVEPYYGGSHRAWLDSLATHSAHSISLFTMPARFWKWRMHGSAVTLSGMLPEKRPDLILTTDMMDTALFTSLVRRKYPGVPVMAYFHENQFGYAWEKGDPELRDGRTYHYQFINISSALTADRVLFNSGYHRSMFLDAIPGFFSMMPDHRPEVASSISEKSTVVYPGIKASGLFSPDRTCRNDKPVLVWNHRREYDKGPNEFEKFLHILSIRNIPFSLILLGGAARNDHPAFSRIAHDFADSISFNGFATERQQYKRLLSGADFAPVFSIQDFFGISIMECAAAGVIPLLPRRLSYPELYGNIGEIFYDSVEEIPEMMNRLTHERRSGISEKLQKCAASYDWEIMHTRYDREFENCVSRFGC